MKIQYKNKKYEATLDIKTFTIGVTKPDNDIEEILNDDRIQRNLLMGYLLNNPYFNLDEVIKNPLL